AWDAASDTRRAMPSLTLTWAERPPGPRGPAPRGSGPFLYLEVESSHADAVTVEGDGGRQEAAAPLPKRPPRAEPPHPDRGDGRGPPRPGHQHGHRRLQHNLAPAAVCVHRLVPVDLPPAPRRRHSD